MKILISNDDGINAPGLHALLQPLKKAGHELVVVAPKYENSAVSHAITVHDPIFVCEHEFLDSEIKGWEVTGRPADCVKMALEVIMKDNLPDLVISGINSGANLGLDTIYSGTVNAALEASMHNIPAIAVSLNCKDPKADYSTAAGYAVQFSEVYFALNLPKATMLNINVPAVPKEKIKGVKLAKLGDFAYDNVFEPRQDLKGRTYYWLGGNMIPNGSSNIDYDYDAVCQNWVTLTPLQHDLTDKESFAKMQMMDF